LISSYGGNPAIALKLAAQRYAHCEREYRADPIPFSSVESWNMCRCEATVKVLSRLENLQEGTYIIVVTSTPAGIAGDNLLI